MVASVVVLDIVGGCPYLVYRIQVWQSKNGAFGRDDGQMGIVLMLDNAGSHATECSGLYLRCLNHNVFNILDNLLCWLQYGLM